MQLRVEAARARVHTAVRVVASCTLLTALGLVVLNPTYVDVYGDAAGQAVLGLVAACWGLALWWLSSMSHFDRPERFLAGDSRGAIMTPILVGLAFGTGLLLVGSGLMGAAPRSRPSWTASTSPAPRPWIQTRQRPSSAGCRHAPRRYEPRPTPRDEDGRRPARRGSTAEELLGAVVVCTVVGLLWLPVTAALLDVGGVHLDPTVSVCVAATLALAGAFVPILTLRGRAARRRRAFRHALSCFLDLVAIRLAGGAGVDGALAESARAGHGWAFEELRRALSGARLAGAPPWRGFERLGDELQVPEVSELAASMALAGDEGARVRASLAAKARAMRTRALADAERSAQAASERMSLPIVVLMAGFVVFLGYPAVMRVIQGI